MSMLFLSRVLLSFLSLLLLVSCTHQQIRDRASEKVRSAEYEGAITGLQEGLKQYPESGLLRSALLQTKSEVIARLTAQAVQERSEGRLDAADKTLGRAINLDPSNSRVLGLRLDFEQTRRVQKALIEVRNSLEQGQKEAALRTIQSALRDAPRNADLLSLQRQLELEQRLASPGVRHLAENRPISLDFRAAPLSALLEAITRGSGVNFMLDRDVRLDGRTTIYIKSGKVEDVLDLILGANQLAKRIVDPTTVLIYPNTPEKQREHQELVIRVFHLAHAEAKTTALMLRNLLRLKEPYVDEKANMLALREPPEVIAVAERLVALHDVAEPEVMLEVEVLEVKTSRLTELGISFPNSFSISPLPATGSTALSVESLRSINSARLGVSVAGLLVNLRREVGDFNTLANPKIRTRNKEKAKILIGDKVPVVTTTNSGSNGLVSENVSYLDVGLKLDVEPTISLDDEVLIKLALEVSSIAREITSAGGSTVFQIGTRNANTVLRLRDGETQILGGLISNEDRSAANRIPGLGDLPIAGRLFSSQRDDYQRTELILAITPRIVRPATRPDIAQAELWIGSEANLRLRAGPQTSPRIDSVSKSASVGSTSASDATATNTLGGNPIQAIAKPRKAQVRWQLPAEVKVGDSFNVTVVASSSTALRGIPIEIKYPSSLLEVVSIAEGGFMKQGDGTTSFAQAVNPISGNINVSLMRNETEGASGEGPLFTIQFKAKAAGAVQLNFSSVRPIGMAGMVNPSDLPSASIQVK